MGVVPMNTSETLYLD